MWGLNITFILPFEFQLNSLTKWHGFLWLMYSVSQNKSQKASSQFYFCRIKLLSKILLLTSINETKSHFSDMDFKTLNLRFQTTWKPCFRSKMFVWFTTWLPCTVWVNWCSLVAILWIATLGTWYSMKVFQIWVVTALEPLYRGLYQNRRSVKTIIFGRSPRYIVTTE